MRTCTVILLCAMLGACAYAPRHSEPLTGPFKPVTDAEARGQRVYAQYCSKCHDGGRASLGPPLLPAPDAVIRMQVRIGLGAMPAFPETLLPARDLDDLMAYLNRIRGGGS
jgi:mono/diheme cytochrome c family protein